MKRKLVLVCLATLAIGSLVECDNRETASSKENLYTQTLMEQSANTVGIQMFPTSLRKLS